MPNQLAEELKERTIVEESDESLCWLTFALRCGMSETLEQKGLLNEAHELVAIFTSSAKTATENLSRR